MGIILSDRDTFIGGHVTEEVKEKIQELAQSRRMSVSALLSTVLEAFVRAEESKKLLPELTPKFNVVLPTVTEVEPPLPFEEK
jgi:hypothetical protein